jgi:hypothetical protein
MKNIHRKNPYTLPEEEQLDRDENILFYGSVVVAILVLALVGFGVI